MFKYLPAAIVAALALTLGAAAGAQTMVVLKSRAEAARFDPQRDTTHASGEVTTLLTDSLTSVDADLKTVRPHLAQSWTVSPDGKTYTFALRRDVKFCNGRAMTAKDVVASFARWRDPATRSLTAARISSVDTIRAPDDYTVEFVLSRPDNELLLQLSTHFAGIVDAQQAAELKDDFGVAAFNGVGPFCFESWAPRQQVVLKRHDAYRWGPPQFDNKGPAKIERMVLKSVPEESTLAATLISGDGMLTSALADWAREKVHKMPNIGWTGSRFIGFSPTLWLRVTKAPLDDPQVRKALAMAIDRPQLAKAVWGRDAPPAWSFSAPGVRDFDASLDKLAVGFDKSGAAKLLDDAGWKPGPDGVRVKNGQKLQLLLYAQDLPQWRNALGAIHGMWRDVGVDLQLQLWEPQVAFGKLATSDWNLTLFNNVHISTGDSLSGNFLSKNIGKSNRIGFGDPEVDKLIELGMQTSSDAERTRAYHDAQVKLLALTPGIPLYNDQRQINYNKVKLKGVKAFGMYGIMMYKALDIELLP